MYLRLAVRQQRSGKGRTTMKSKKVGGALTQIYVSKHRAKPSMWIVRLFSLGATMLLILASRSAAQTPAPDQRVLVLYSDERLLPANIIMDEAIRAAFAGGTKKRIEFYSEFLDVARFSRRGAAAAAAGFF
jgi:hypothetical protein